MYFLLNASPPKLLDLANSNIAGFIGQMMLRQTFHVIILGNISCDLDLGVKVK